MVTHGDGTVACALFAFAHVVHLEENSSLRSGHDCLQCVGDPYYGNQSDGRNTLDPEASYTIQVRIYNRISGFEDLHFTNVLVEYSIFERINIATFFVQETILSGLYLWKSRSLLGRYNKGDSTTTDRSTTSRTSSSLPIVRSILCQLISVNLLVIILDVVTVVLEVSQCRDQSTKACLAKDKGIGAGLISQIQPRRPHRSH